MSYNKGCSTRFGNLNALLSDQSVHADIMIFVGDAIDDLLTHSYAVDGSIELFECPIVITTAAPEP